MRMPPTMATRRTFDPISMCSSREAWTLVRMPRKAADTIGRMRIFTGFTVAVTMCACASSPTHRSPDAALNALAEEYFERQLELSPMNATSIGDDRYDDRLDES